MPLPAVPPTGEGNLLALAVDAARERATLGEISDAMEKAFGRHTATIRSISRRVQQRGQRRREL